METLDQQTLANLDPETVERPLVLLATAALAGGTAEMALHSWLVDGQPPGVGIAIAVAVIATGLIRTTTRLDRAPNARTVSIYMASIGFAALTAFRASAPLISLNLVVAVYLLGLAATTHHPAASRPAFISDFARAAAQTMSNSWFGGLLVAARDLHDLELPSTDRLRRVVLGFFMALPVLMLFGVLFMSADEVFNDAISTIFRFQLPDGVAPALVIAALLAWLILGLLRGIVVHPPEAPTPTDRRFIGPVESSTAMWLFNGLFAVFVGFQVFEAVVSYQSATVSFAQQARSGFFQLVWVAAIVVVVVLALDWLVLRSDLARLHRQQRILVGLTGAVLVSAVVRMALYVDAYGLTRLRLFTTVFMLWIAFALFWLTRSVLGGHRRRFARPAVAGLLGAVLVLNIINPDGLIASYNLDHTPRLAIGIDHSYLYSDLSPDAVPVIVANISTFGDSCDQLDVLQRLPAIASNDLRSWNLARSVAADRVSALQQELAQLCPSG